MIRNLVAAGSNHKQKLSAGGRRLRGWINYRVSKSTKPWVELRLNEFVELTGISIRTCRRQLEILRTDPAHDIVIRTIHENRRWKLFASTTGRLHGLKRSEPFTRNANGVSLRIVKIHKDDSRQLKEEQLYLGADPHYWKAKSNDTLDTKSSAAPELCSATPDHPEQETLNLLVGESERTVNPHPKSIMARGLKILVSPVRLITYYGSGGWGFRFGSALHWGCRGNSEDCKSSMH